MMTKLVRPCTHEAFNDNEAFEAIGAVVSVVEGGTSNGVQQFAVKLDLANGHSEELDFENRGRAYYTYQSVLLAIYEALNAPVLATEEVLGGLYMAKYHTGDFEPQFLVDTQTQSLSETSEPPEEWVDLTPKWAEPFLESRMFPMSDEEEWCYRHYAVANGKTMYKHEWEGYENVVRVLGHKIKANECAKTAEYLRQFHTDGTPILK